MSLTAFAAPFAAVTEKMELPVDPFDAPENRPSIKEPLLFDTSETYAITEPMGSPVSDVATTPPRPLTQPGTGTVTDNATDGDGKEFFTITTADGNVFYLVIDRQRNSENVYFLNAVTEADLLPLARLPERPAPAENPAPLPPKEEATPAFEPELPQQAAQDTGGGGNRLLAAIAALALIGGGAFWYFKVYKPKHRRGGEGYGDGYQDTGGDEDLWNEDNEENDDGGNSGE